MNFQPPDPPEEDEGERWERHLLSVEAENAKLRQIISECATACGAAVSVECSIEFMALLPGEIALLKKLCDGRGKRLAEMEQRP